MNNMPVQCIEEDEIDLRELFNTILRRKKLIIIMTALITVLAGIYAFMKTPIYEVKSNIEIGHIGDTLIADPIALNKRLNIVFNVEDKIDTKEKFVSKVSSIALNKKAKKFITVITEAISNDEALKKNKEVILYAQQVYKAKIDNFIFNNNNSIRAVKTQIENLEKLEKPNLQRDIKILKTQKMVKIDNKIKFYTHVKLKALREKLTHHKEKLKEYIKSINNIYKNNKNTTNATTLTISSLQMVNYQNLILNSQNKIEDLKVEIEIIKNQTIPNLQRDKNNLINDTLRKLKYQLAVTLVNKKLQLQEKMKLLKYNNSSLFCKNSEVVGKYVMHDYASKPKKKLIIIVAFITGLILSIFLVFFLEFLASSREEEPKR